MSDELLTTKQVSERLGVTQYRVQQLIRAARLPAVLYGKVHLVKEADLVLVADRKPGRPKKADEVEPTASAARPIAPRAQKNVPTGEKSAATKTRRK